MYTTRPFESACTSAIQKIMKIVDMRNHVIVDSGQTWPHAKKPCSKV